MSARARGAANAQVSPHGAEADGNRTRQGAFAPSPVLKTVGPTRNPDASAPEDTGDFAARVGSGTPRSTHG